MEKKVSMLYKGVICILVNKLVTVNNYHRKEGVNKRVNKWYMLVVKHRGKENKVQVVIKSGYIGPKT